MEQHLLYQRSYISYEQFEKIVKEAIRDNALEEVFKRLCSSMLASHDQGFEACRERYNLPNHFASA